MRITQIETFLVPPRWLFVKIDTDDGVHGWGEAILQSRPKAVEGAISDLAQLLIGEDPTTVEAHWTRLYRGGFYRGGGTLMSALSALDQAMWDIKGKALGISVCRMLGGPVRERIQVYSWIGGDRPQATGEAAQQAVERGFKAVKMLVCEEMNYIDSNARIDAAVSKVAAVRDAVGFDLGIGIDFHGRVHRPMVKALARQLEPLRPMFYEEPLLSEHADALLDLAHSTTVPLALGERLFTRWEFKKIFEGGAIALIQPDASHAGGITETKKIAAMAESYDIGLALHCPLGPIALAACLQLDGLCQNAVIQEQSLGIHYNKTNDLLDYLVEPKIFKFTDGYVDIPDGPGLGIDINEEYVRQRAKIGPGARRELWKHPDGSFAEW